jgi:hypothetical protein
LKIGHDNHRSEHDEADDEDNEGRGQELSFGGRDDAFTVGHI